MGLSRAEVEVLLRMRTEGQQALDLFAGTLGTVEGAGNRAASGLGNANRETKNSEALATAAGVAMGEFATKVGEKLVALGQDTVLTAARTQGLTAVAEYLGQKAGQTRSQVDGLVDSIKKQGVTTQEASNLVIQLSRSNLGLENATKLATVAQNGAFIAGESTAEAINQIITGVIELEPRLIRSAGITVSLEQAEKNYARTLGVSTDALSTHQKQQALLQAVLTEGDKINGVYALSMQYVGKQLTSLPRYIEEAKNAIGGEMLPVLGVGVTAFTDLLKIVTAHPAAFVALGGAAVAVAGPLLIAKAAALAGVPSFAALTTTVTASASALALFAGRGGGGAPWIGGLADTRAGVQLVGEAAGITYANLGLLGSAAALAGAAFGGWQLGKIIDQLTGASSAVETFTYDVQRMTGGLGNDLLNAAERAAAKQDVLARATQNAGRTITDYSEAIKINTAVVAIRQAAFDKSADAQRKAVDAELYLGKITIDQANAQRLAIAEEERLGVLRAARVRYTDVVTASETAFTKAIEATGYSHAELLAMMAKDEVGFLRWADTVQFGADNIKRLKDELTKQKEAQTQAAEQAKKYQKAIEDVANLGDGWVGTLLKIPPAIRAQAESMIAAGADAEDLTLILKLTQSQYAALSKDVEQSKQQDEKATEAKKKLADATDEVLSAGDSWKATVAGINPFIREYGTLLLAAGVGQSALATYFGLTDTQVRALARSLSETQKAEAETKKSLEETADLWDEFYDLQMQRSGTTSDYQISQITRWADKEIGKLKESDKNWADHYNAIESVANAKIAAIIAAQDPLFTAWKGMNEDMRLEWADTWTKALDGEISWRKAATQPFEDLRTGLKRIFAAILADFEAVLLNPLLQMARKAIGNILSSITGGSMVGPGASSGAAAGLAGLAPFGLFGANAGANGMPGTPVALSLPGSGSGSWLGMSRGQSTALGAGLAGLAPFGLFGANAGANGMPGTPVALSLPGSGSGSWLGMSRGQSTALGAGLALDGAMRLMTAQTKTSGALSGLETGAGIGTMIAPGIGTAIGAGVGALGGLFVGMFNNSSGRKSVTDFLDKNGGPDAVRAQLNDVPGGDQLWVNLTQKVGKGDTAAATAAENAVTAAIAKAAQDKTDKAALSGDLTRYGFTDPTAIAGNASTLMDSYNRLTGAGGKGSDQAIGAMAGDLNGLIAASLDAGVKIPANMKPVIEQLINMGKLTDENARKLLGLKDPTTVAFDDITASAQRYGITMDQLGPKVNQINIDQLSAQISQDWKNLTSDGEDTAAVMDKMKGSVQDVINEALNMGDSIPESMKGVIDSMINAGDLTDQFGNKLTDDSKLNFAKPINEEFDDLDKSIDKLVDVLTGQGQGSLASALDRIGNTTVRPKIQPTYDGSDVPDFWNPDGGGGPVYRPEVTGTTVGGAAAGIFTSRPTLAIFGEGGEPELGGPVSFMAKALAMAQKAAPASAAVGGDIHIHLPAGAVGADVRRATQDFADMVRTDGTLRERVRKALRVG